MYSLIFLKETKVVVIFSKWKWFRRNVL